MFNLNYPEDNGLPDYMCIVTNNYLICPGKHMQVIPEDISIDDCMSYCEIFGHVIVLNNSTGCLNVQEVTFVYG